jgi:hypothetical protein
MKENLTSLRARNVPLSAEAEDKAESSNPDRKFLFC